MLGTILIDAYNFGDQFEGYSNIKTVQICAVCSHARVHIVMYTYQLKAP